MKDGYPTNSRIPIIELPRKIHLFDKGTNSHVYFADGRVYKLYQDPRFELEGTTPDKLLMYQEGTNHAARSERLKNPVGAIQISYRQAMDIYLVINPLERVAHTPSGILYADVEDIEGPRLNEAYDEIEPPSIRRLPREFQEGFRNYRSIQYLQESQVQMGRILRESNGILTEITGYSGIDVTHMPNIKPRFHPDLSRADLVVTDLCTNIDHLTQANYYQLDF